MNCELSASSELFHRAGSCHQSCGQHAHAGSHTSLSLGFCSNRDDVVLQLWAPFLWIRQAGGGRRAEPLQTAKPAQQLRPLTGSAEAISRCVGVKPGTLWEPPFPGEPEPCPFGSAWPGFCCAVPHLCDSWRDTSKMKTGVSSRWVTSSDDWPPQSGWSSGWVGWIFLWKAHRQAQLGASEAQWPLRSPPNGRASSWSPSLKPLGSILTHQSLPQNLGPNENNKAFL